MDLTAYLSLTNNNKQKNVFRLMAEFLKSEISQTLPGFTENTINQNLAYEICRSVEKSFIHQQARRFFNLIDMTLVEKTVNEEILTLVIDSYLEDLLGKILSHLDNYNQNPFFNAINRVEASVCKDIFRKVRRYSEKYTNIVIN